jgi:hypothetical protein
MSAASRPRMRMRPALGREIRASSLSAVVFPAPLGPISATLSPSSTAKVMSSSASLPRGRDAPRSRAPAPMIVERSEA